MARDPSGQGARLRPPQPRPILDRQRGVEELQVKVGRRRTRSSLSLLSRAAGICFGGRPPPPAPLVGPPHPPPAGSPAPPPERHPLRSLRLTAAAASPRMFEHCIKHLYDI